MVDKAIISFFLRVILRGGENGRFGLNGVDGVNGKNGHYGRDGQDGLGGILLFSRCHFGALSNSLHS